MNVSTSKYPIVWEKCSEEETAENKRLFHPKDGGYSSELNQIKHDAIRMPSKYLLIAEQVYNMEVRPDDVWVVTFKKCGTTWTSVIIFSL